MTQRHAQQGLALITAMLIVAIVATIAAYLSMGQQLWLRQAQNLADRSQADNMRHAALDWIGIMLVREAKNNQTDHLGEIWAKALPPLPYEGGTILVAISDAQGRFNLNNLVRNGEPSAADIGVFRNLLSLLNLDPGLVEAVVDWIDANGQTRPGGAEDTEYLATTRPYRAANQMMSSVDELRLIKGFTPAMVDALRPYVTVLPQITSINANTAPDVVLAALFRDMSVSAIQPVVQARDKQPFSDIADMLKQVPPGQSPLVNPVFSTSFFLVRLDIGYGRWLRSTVALIQRPGGNQAARVLWHQPQYPKLPRDGDETENKG